MSEWISVEERLPSSDHDWVLVACKLMPEGFYGVPHVAELRGGVWWSDCYDVPLRSAGVAVTHWMPLPEPPVDIAELATTTATGSEEVIGNIHDNPELMKEG